MSKYGNKQTTASDGTVLASKRERNRYEELLLLQRCGDISDLKTQVKYVLIPKQEGERAGNETCGQCGYLVTHRSIHAQYRGAQERESACDLEEQLLRCGEHRAIEEQQMTLDRDRIDNLLTADVSLIRVVWGNQLGHTVMISADEIRELLVIARAVVNPPSQPNA
jgi:hypothetical protein